MSYYLHEDGKTRGPFTIGQLRSMWNAGTINLETTFSTTRDGQRRVLEEMLNDIEGSTSISPQEKIQTVELTSKKWKKLQAMGCLLPALGLLVTMPVLGSMFELGFVIIIAGVILLIYASLGAWWENR